MIAPALATITSLVAGTSTRWLCDPDAAAQRIYYGNHSSHLDFVIIWSSLPTRARQCVRPVAGGDYWEKGRIRRFVARDVFRAVLIPRSGPGECRCRTARTSIERLAHELEDRQSLIIFPEGTRTADGEVGPFKSGLFHLARLRPDVELIPVYLENLNRILPKGEVLPVPMLSRAVFGRPLAWIDDEDKHGFLTRARDALLQLRAA
jgi:1-acyl-sn-glycerol-3-phosphate acyltransferase